MSDAVDGRTGEVTEGHEHELVPLNLAALDESALLAMFPSPIQATGALLIARGHLATAPAVLHERSKAVRAAKRNLIVAKGYARAASMGKTAEDRRADAESHADVITAWEELDTAELALEYAREMRKTLSEDIEVLRSINANFRDETR